MTPVYQLNPLTDGRWEDFLRTCASASVFHSLEWLRTLQRTYGYEPVVFTTCPPGRALTNGIVFCHVKSWLTGRRWVSLPFADHCEPLCDDPEQVHALLHGVARQSESNQVGRVEIRPLPQRTSTMAENTSFVKEKEFTLHLLDIRPKAAELLQACDHSCVQRRLKHAEREHLSYEEGTGASTLKKFYDLLVLTRKRHGVPPQPLSWFENLLSSFGDKARISVACLGAIPVASLLTLTYKRSVTYKYGGSDERYHKLGGMVSLFWRAIQDAKRHEALTFDMGRSDVDNPGLIRFKSNWGAQQLPLVYWCFPQPSPKRICVSSRAAELGGSLVHFLPSRLLISVGNALYRHAG